MDQIKKSAPDELEVQFVVKQFIFNGEEYSSRDLEQRIKSGDAKAARLVAHLVEIGSGVVKQVNS